MLDMHHTQKKLDKNCRENFYKKLEHLIWKYKSKSALPALILTNKRRHEWTHEYKRCQSKDARKIALENI